jgi:D-glycero-alpha-D-manno-heptose-7-phosphate kinase
LPRESQLETHATGQLKALALDMKKAIISSDLYRMADILDRGFQHKKKIASGISSPALESIYDAAMHAGAIGGKISGAGGGGFIVFFTPPSKREAVKKALTKFDGREFPFYFVDKGLTTWTE